MAKLIIIIEDIPSDPGKTGIRITGAVQDHDMAKPDTRAMKIGKATLEAIQAAHAGRGVQIPRPIDEDANKRVESIVEKALTDINGPTPVRPKVRLPMRRAPRGRRT